MHMSGQLKNGKPNRRPYQRSSDKFKPGLDRPIPGAGLAIIVESIEPFPPIVSINYEERPRFMEGPEMGRLDICCCQSPFFCTRTRQD